MTGHLFVLGITTFLSALLVAQLAVAGIRRLEGSAVLYFPGVVGLTLVGSSLGCLFGLLYLGNIPQPGILHVILILFFGLLTASALVDYQTLWAPLELQIPTSLCLGIVAWSCVQPTLAETLLNASMGLGLLGLSHCFWLLQVKFYREIFPPMDILAAFVPVLLFGGTRLTLIFYSLLVLLLACIRFRPFISMYLGRPKDREEKFIPLLAVIYPLTLSFMMWEVFLGPSV